MRLQLISSREFHVLYLPLAAVDELKSYKILTLDRGAEATSYLDTDLGVVARQLKAIDRTSAADAFGKHGLKNLRVRNFRALHDSLCPRRCGI